MNELSKLEYIATHLMAANLSSPELLQIVTSGSVLDGTMAQRCAKVSVEYARALLEEINPDIKKKTFQDFEKTMELYKAAVEKINL